MQKSDIKFFVHSPGVVNVHAKTENGLQRTAFIIVRCHGQDKIGFKAWTVLQINSITAGKVMPTTIGEYVACKEKVIEWIVANEKESFLSQSALKKKPSPTVAPLKDIHF
jgi:hypothetical protein